MCYSVKIKSLRSRKINVKLLAVHKISHRIVMVLILMFGIPVRFLL
jgi:hypothetical protein